MAEPAFPLHPRSAGDILDHAVRLYRRHFLSFLKLVLVPFPIMLSASIWMEFLSRGERWMQDVPGVLLWVSLLLANMFLASLAGGAVARWVSDQEFGTTLHLWKCYRPVLRRSASLALANLLSVLLLAGGILVPVAGIVGIGMAGWGSWDAWGVVPVSLALVAILILGAINVGGAIITVRVFLYVVAIVLEDIGWWAAFRRSWRLVRGNSWRTVAIILFTLALAFGPPILVNTTNELLEEVMGSLVSVLFSDTLLLVLSPLWGIAETLLYYDCRVRKEGFDLETMAKSLAASSQRP